MNYEDMSVLNVNRSVAKALGYKLNEGVSHEQDSGCFEGCEQEFYALIGEPGMGDSFDFCNNPSDAWPIIVDNKITISPQDSGDEWEASASVNDDLRFDFEVWDKNPLRAAMICFLKMKDAE